MQRQSPSFSTFLTGKNQLIVRAGKGTHFAETDYLSLIPNKNKRIEVSFPDFLNYLGSVNVETFRLFDSGSYIAYL